MEEESPVIILPEDAEHVEMLRRKQKEYAERFGRYHRKVLEEMECSHPDLRRLNFLNCGSAYSLRIISELLRNGRVNTFDLSLKISNKNQKLARGDSQINLGFFNNSCTVVQRYCEDKEFLRQHLK